ncbi:MAG: hypothetical protein EXR75_03860 [Myxococcales bacterium]|nr:hypothetical protein [Myxococcales bacterium]
MRAVTGPPKGKPEPPRAAGTSATPVIGNLGPCAPVPDRHVHDTNERRAAILPLLEHRPAIAKQRLKDIVRSAPGDIAAMALHTVASAELLQAAARLADEISGQSQVTLAALPVAHGKPGFAMMTGPAVSLRRVSATKNLITDDADWLTRNRVVPRAQRLGRDDVPDGLPSRIHRAVLHVLFTHADHSIGLYGSSTLGIFSPGKKPVIVNAAALLQPAAAVQLELNFAQLAGKSLFVQASHNGYAKDVGNKTAYVAAFAIDSGALLWSSDPLVANANNFVIRGTTLIAGYGFTTEPDHLYLLDARTGDVQEKLPLKSGPDMILTRADELFVRTYDHDYVFAIAPASASEPTADLEDATQSSSDVSEALRLEQSCLLDHALAAIDVRDPARLKDSIAGLERSGADRGLRRGLEQVAEFLEGQRVGNPRLDLTSSEIRRIPSVAWERTTTRAELPGLEPAPRLTRKRSPMLAPPISNNPPSAAAPQAEFIAPALNGRLPSGARQDIPSSYGFESLRAIIPDGDRLNLIYGGRYLAIVNGNQAESIWDLESLRHPPAANPQWKDFAVQDLTYALVRNGVLFVANGGGGYAREVFGKKGFLTAIELATGRVLWRSAPLVNNVPFVFLKDHIVTAYGFTDEADHVFVLRRDTGAVVQKLPIESGPSAIDLVGDVVVVQTYNGQVAFDVAR